ncbi:uncharacterized protein LOC118469362 isoform X2 [Amphiprion ocellaris]|uniref:uncharacterized protein LOC118469362 isoform X2 n=1 Tax=Amphiprion ocellaris TaxID=80972 RepID=UPI002410E91A|nr:uncharacterized protein LOC118469362 isoform X2 [Amphiprion ocellaris]
MLLIVTQKEEVGVQRENPTQSQRQHGRKEPDDQQTKKQFEEPQDDRQQKKRVREQEEDDQQHQTEKKKKKQTPEEEEKEEEEKLQITPKVEAELVRMTPAPVISKLLTHLYLHMRKITPVECRYVCHYYKKMLPGDLSETHHTESAKIMFTHIRKRKTCINISIPNLFRHHEINKSYLWPLQLQEVLKVVATGFQTFLLCCRRHLLMLHS